LRHAQATDGFARRGLKILPLDFEAWRVETGAFRLVAAAEAWRWVAPNPRFTKA
jgi:hypothetical protein